MRVLGIDLSLIRPGIAAVDPHLPPLAGTLHLNSLLKPSKAVEAKPVTARRLKAVKAKAYVPLDLPARMARLRQTRDYVRQVVAAAPTELAVMERMYVDRVSDEVLERAWAWGIVAEDLLRMGVPVAMVPPSTLKVYATGSGKADKAAMLQAARDKWPDVEFEDDNAADACWLAAMGARYLGRPCDGEASEVSIAALSGAEWPALMSDDGAEDVAS